MRQQLTLKDDIVQCDCLLFALWCVDKLYRVDGDTHTSEGFADTDEGYQMKDAGGLPHFVLVIVPCYWAKCSHLHASVTKQHNLNRRKPAQKIEGRGGDENWLESK